MQALHKQRAVATYPRSSSGSGVHSYNDTMLELEGQSGSAVSKLYLDTIGATASREGAEELYWLCVCVECTCVCDM